MDAWRLNYRQRLLPHVYLINEALLTRAYYGIETIILPS
jgi:hypothetical protein